jgi:hypothetical protein
LLRLRNKPFFAPQLPHLSVDEDCGTASSVCCHTEQKETVHALLRNGFLFFSDCLLRQRVYFDTSSKSISQTGH